tara:strand:- start:3639 stop:4853 length:1215 start_codon:yes stop_codon:yes gene_type:complete
MTTIAIIKNYKKSNIREKIMKKFLKNLSKILFVSFIAFPAFGETIKVGFAVPLTGEYAPYAEVQGAKCMAEIINKNGGVNGKKFELLIQDTGTDTQTALALTEKFLEQGVIAIGTIPFADTMIPVAQIAAGYGVTILQAQSTQVEMHTGMVDNFISNVSPDPFTAAAAAEYALSEGVKNVVLLTSDDGGSWSARTPLWFGDVIENGGGKVLSKMNFSIPTSDWSPQVAEMKKLSTTPDAVYISSVMPDVGVLIRQMKAAGIDAWVFGSDGLDDPSLDSVADSDKSILDKVAFGTLAPSQPGSAMQDFQKECKAMGMPVDGMFPALGSDVIMAIAYAVEKTGGTDPEAIRKALRDADSIPVRTVESVSFKKNKSHSERTVPVIGFKDGVRVLLSNTIPSFVPSWK